MDVKEEILTKGHWKICYFPLEGCLNLEVTDLSKKAERIRKALTKLFNSGMSSMFPLNNHTSNSLNSNQTSNADGVLGWYVADIDGSLKDYYRFGTDGSFEIISAYKMEWRDSLSYPRGKSVLLANEPIEKMTKSIFFGRELAKDLGVSKVLLNVNLLQLNGRRIWPEQSQASDSENYCCTEKGWSDSFELNASLGNEDLTRLASTKSQEIYKLFGVPNAELIARQGQADLLK